MGDRFCIKTETGLKPATELQRAVAKPELIVPCEEEEKPPVAPKDVYKGPVCIKTETGLRPVPERNRALIKPELLVPCGEEGKSPVAPKDTYEAKGSGEELPIFALEAFKHMEMYGFRVSPTPNREFICDWGIDHSFHQIRFGKEIEAALATKKKKADKK